MSPKEYLLQIRRLEAKIRRIDAEIKWLRTESVSLRSPWPDGQPHGYGKTDQVAEAAIRLAEKITEAERLHIEARARLFEKRTEIVDTIGRLEDPALCEILSKRYVDGASWERISAESGYSMRHTLRIHGEALEKIKAFIPENVQKCH